ncbi:hypothetical protein CHUAL_013042 [Chamberlinius hualienensis]
MKNFVPKYIAIDLINCSVSCSLADKDDQLLLEVDTDKFGTKLYISHPLMGVDLQEGICHIPRTLKVHRKSLKKMCAHKVRDIKEKSCDFIPSLPFIL